uniref:Mutant cadherin n=1 Tax=Heliothis virescens TaxID=7102 RepID=A0A2A4JA45_HELVI
MDEDSIVKVCNSAFSSEDVDIAKTLLFKSVTTTIKKVTRRSQNKVFRDLEDIIMVFKNTDPENVPIFVAKDLNKLPPVTFDHIDVTRLMKDIIVLQSEIKQIKEEYATKELLENIKNHCNKSQSSDIKNSEERGASTLNAKNVLDDESICVFEQGCSYADLTKQISPRAVTPMRHGGNAVPLAEVQTKTLNVTAVQLPMNTHDVRQETPSCGNEEGWTLVKSRKKHSRFVGKKGTNVDSTSKFKAADIKIPFLLYNVAKGVSSADIASYVKEKTQVDVVPELIEVKHSKEYASFKLYIPKQQIDLFEKDNIWPEGVFFRRYFVFKTKSTRGTETNKASE